MNYRIPALPLTHVVAAFLFSAECLAQSHCQRGEMNYFSCAIRGTKKVASLCGNKIKYNYETGGLYGSIQYRFGRLGKPELIFPKNDAGSVTRFKGISTKGYRVSYDEISFQNQGALYGLVVETTGESEGFAGVEVNLGKKTARFYCDNWPLPKSNYSIDNDFPNDFYDLVRDLHTAAD